MNQLSVENFIGRACTLLLIFFCLVSVIGYVELPFTIPTHFDDDGLPDHFANKLYIFIIPGIGMLLYMLISHFEKYAYQPVKKFRLKRAMVYYRSMARFIGVFKLLLLLSGIILTAEFIHHSFNVQEDYDMECDLLAAILISVPIVLMANEFINIRKEVLAK